MLLRSAMNESHNYNIDIIFFGVKYISACVNMSDISIYENEDSLINNAFNAYRSSDEKLFTIDSGNTKMFVLCSHFRVYENNMRFEESSLGFDMSGRENMVYSSK